MERLEIDRRDGEVHLVLRMRPLPLMALGYVVLTGTTVGSGIEIASTQGTWLRVSLILAPVVVAFLLAAAWMLFGRERIVIRDGGMTHRRELGPLRGRTRRLQRAEVTKVRVEPYSRRWWQVNRSSSWAETFEYHGLIRGSLRHRKLRFGARLNREDAKELLATVRRELRA